MQIQLPRHAVPHRIHRPIFTWGEGGLLKTKTVIYQSEVYGVTEGENLELGPGEAEVNWKGIPKKILKGKASLHFVRPTKYGRWQLHFQLYKKEEGRNNRVEIYVDMAQALNVPEWLIDKLVDLGSKPWE